MPDGKDVRAGYFIGYHNALQDVVRKLRPGRWLDVSEVINNLTEKAVYDAILETEKEVKVPDAAC